MPASEVAEGQGRPERDAGARVVSVHDRAHVVTAGIETVNRGPILLQDPCVGVGLETDRSAEIGRMDTQRKKRRVFDRSDSWVGRMA